MTLSNNVVDSRLINLYKIRKMHEKGNLVGLDTQTSSMEANSEKGMKRFFTKLFKNET